MNGTAPNVRNQAPVGSRWMFNAETKGRVFVVTDRKPGGIVEYKQEGRAYFGRSYLRQFLANAHFVGEQQPPNAEFSGGPAGPSHTTGRP